MFSARKTADFKSLFIRAHYLCAGVRMREDVSECWVRVWIQHPVNQVHTQAVSWGPLASLAATGNETFELDTPRLGRAKLRLPLMLS